MGYNGKESQRANVGCTTSFKVIEEKDEIIEMNDELLGELERERERNSLLELEIERLSK